MEHKPIKDPADGATRPDPPVCHAKPMIINARINRVSGPRIIYRCTVCGHTRTVAI